MKKRVAVLLFALPIFSVANAALNLSKYPTPIANHLRDLSNICKESDGVMKGDESQFLQRVDLNRDGVKDYIVYSEYLACTDPKDSLPSLSHVYNGQGTRIFVVEQDKSVRLVFSTQNLAIRPSYNDGFRVYEGSSPKIMIGFSEGCKRGACSKAIVWNPKTRKMALLNTEYDVSMALPDEDQIKTKEIDDLIYEVPFLKDVSLEGLRKLKSQLIYHKKTNTETGHTGDPVNYFTAKYKDGLTLGYRTFSSNGKTYVDLTYMEITSPQWKLKSDIRVGMTASELRKKIGRSHQPMARRVETELEPYTYRCSDHSDENSGSHLPYSGENQEVCGVVFFFEEDKKINSYEREGDYKVKKIKINYYFD